MPADQVMLFAGFGLVARFWQLGIEMRPFFNRNSLWVYPVYATIGGAFGYWLKGAEANQLRYLSAKRDALHEKRRRRLERINAGSGEAAAPVVAGATEGITVGEVQGGLGQDPVERSEDAGKLEGERVKTQ